MVAGLAVWVFLRLQERWVFERSDHRMAILVEWTEVRELAMRQALKDQEMLELLRGSGITGLLLSELTVSDLLRTQSDNAASQVRFENSPIARQTLHQMESRGIEGLRLNGFTIERTLGPWSAIGDVEIGIQPQIPSLAAHADFGVVLRINQNPWMSSGSQIAEARGFLSQAKKNAVLFSSDEIPGGADASDDWGALVKEQGGRMLLPEIKPAKAAVRLTQRQPFLSYRTHTISTAELRDLTPGKEMARWRRAVEERSCRFLLMHPSGSDSLVSWLAHAKELREDLERRGWQMQWPSSRDFWQKPSGVPSLVISVLALGAALLTPLLSFYLFRTDPTSSAGVVPAYLKICLGTVAGACMVAAIAQTPEAQLQIAPFRGIKLAFLGGWIGSIFLIYRSDEMLGMVKRPVRWIEMLVAAVALGIVAYMLVRTGNASPVWKAGWEQGLRDRLDDLLWARPRFKEFAIGHPLLILGLYLHRQKRSLSILGDGRLWMSLGMIGQASIVNTFCHLHSPLQLAFIRTVNGCMIGLALGLILVGVCAVLIPKAEGEPAP